MTGTLGVADLTLPCGTLVTLTSLAGRPVTVPVIDRGPFVAGRTLDLTAATKLALACTDLCHLAWPFPDRTLSARTWAASSAERAASRKRTQ